MINTLLSLAVALGVFFAPNYALSQVKYGIGTGSVRKALRGGEIEEALAYYEALARESNEKALASGSESDWRVASKVYHLASIAARYAGQLQKAVTYGNEALDAAQKTRNEARRLGAIKDLAIAYRMLGNFEKYKELIDKGFEIIRKLPAGNRRRSWEARYYHQFGMYHISVGEYEKAIEALSKTRSLSETYLSRLENSKTRKKQRIESTRNRILNSIIRIGQAYHAIGKLELALEQYQTALSLINEWGIQTHHDTKVYREMGNVFHDLKKYPQALQSIKKALVLFHRQQRPHHIATLNRTIGDVYSSTARPAEAIPHYQEAVRGIESARSLLQSDYRHYYFANELGAYIGIIDALLKVGKPGEAFSYNEHARARQFLDLLGNKVRLSRAKSGLAEEEMAMNERIASVKTKMTRGMRQEGLVKELSSVEIAYENFLIKVREVDREQTSLMTVAPLSLKEVQRLLDPDATLIQYFVTNSTTFVWVVEKGKLQYHGVQVPKEKLARLVNTLRERIASLEDKEKIREVSAFLYQALIKPVRSHISGKQLIIVPHDVLHYLPFQALVSPEGRYLIEDYPVHYLTSASLMKFTTAKRRTARGDRVLAIGNPDLEGAKRELKFAEAEAKEVGKLYQQIAVLLRNEATEEAIKSLSSKYDILHFAAHTELSKDDPSASAILLAKDGKEDGRLTVKEIFEMDL
ncbi:MAG: CHAT domain-containing tetratricopeptide repeat protein, partial [Nitrososphaerales archaeon]